MNAVATKERPAKAASALKLTIDRGDFLRALSHAVAIVESRNMIPILSNVLLETGEEFLWITATDLDLQIRISVPANIESSGSTTVSARILGGIIRELEDGSQVELALADGRLQVNSGRSRYKLQTLPGEDFPIIQSNEAMTTLKLDAGKLAKALRQVDHAQSTEETRYYLCGVHLENEGGRLVLAATDGNQLAFANIEGAGEAQLDAILPMKLVRTLDKLLDGEEGNVEIAVAGDRKLVAQIGKAVVTSKLVDGTYPEWRRVLPSNTDKVLLIGTDSLRTAIKRVSVVAADRKTKFALEQDKLTVSVFSQENGTAAEEVPCVWDGGEFTIGFNARYLLNVLDAAGEGEIEARLIDAASPTLFSNPADDSARWIVMPMRV